MPRSSSDLDLEKLRRALAVVLDEVEHRFGTQIDLPVDYYTTVDIDDAFLAEVPKAEDWLLGQVTDDLDEMDDILARSADPEDMIFPWHDLEHLIGILRAVAHLDHQNGTEQVLARALDPKAPA